jgi:hypothetical protein
MYEALPDRLAREYPPLPGSMTLDAYFSSASTDI